MRWMFRIVPVAMLLMLMAFPAQADDAEPTLKTITSARQANIFMHNGKPIDYCQFTFENYNRAYGVCHTVADLPEFEYVTGDLYEEVYYDGTAYVRFRDEATWYSMPDETYDPAMTVEQAYRNYITPPFTLTNLGKTRTINGVAVNQYQYWHGQSWRFPDSPVTGAHDLFVTDDGWLLGFANSWTGTFPVSDPGVIHLFISFSDINQPLKVYKPDPAKVKPATSAMFLRSKLIRRSR
ncbi:MAG: hypothetical protein KAX40_03555 [Herpetosiphon sp.]|nr:hypothetical protein [Herpetosiphon sp.]